MCQHCNTNQQSLFSGINLDEIVPQTSTSLHANTASEEDSQVECDECNTKVDVASSYDMDGKSLCSNCIIMCEGCDDIFNINSENAPIESIKSFYPRRTACLCDDCRFKCADCNNWCSKEMSTCYNSEDRICEQCDENYYVCDGCAYAIHTDDIHNFVDEDEYYCEDCYADERRRREEEDESEDEDKLLYNYDYKPSPIFHGKVGSKLYAGIEIECDGGKSPKDVIASANFRDSDFYCKHDGSLGSEGFEIVSHPRTWQSWCEHAFAWAKPIRDGGYKSYDTTTCGMHVHLTRSFFSDLDILKLLKFFTKEAEFVFRMSRRATRDNLFNSDMGYAVIAGDAMKELKQQDDRYSAINLQNSKTIEFRIFRGTLNVRSIKRNLSLIFALVHYVKETSLSHINLASFEIWVDDRAHVFLGKTETKSLWEWMMGVDSKCEV